MEQCPGNFSTQRPSLSAAKRFGQFKPEGQHPVRVPEIRSYAIAEGLKRAWAKCSYNANNGNDYFKMLNITRDLGYSAKDVEAFSMELAGFQNERQFSDKAGLFLSALINNCKEDDFVVHTVHLTQQIHHI